MRLWRAAFASALLGVLFIALGAPAAFAASSDVFDRFDLVASVDTEGYVQVTETIVLRFGSSSGRHGLERTLVTREADGDDHDVVYNIDQVSVSSPDPVSTRLDLSDQGNGRNTYLRIRIGSAERTVNSATATYVLKYRVQGLLRDSGDFDELYWDLTGSSMPRIVAATATITVPGGAQDVFCSVAEPGSSGPCGDGKVASSGAAQFTAANIPTGQLMTVSVKITSGLVSGNTPIRVENAETAAARSTGMALLGSLAGAAVVPFIGWWYIRRRTADYRFEGLPPGLFPAPGQPVTEVRNDPRMEIPVAFAPPRLAVAEAGLLVDGETQVRDTTATLVGLAVAGAIQLRSDEEQQVRLLDPSRAPDAISADLLANLFPRGSEPGTVLDLGEPGTLTEAHDRAAQLALVSARNGGWFAREPGASAQLGCGLIGLMVPVAAFGIMSSAVLGPLLLLSLPLVISLAATGFVVRSKLRRGQRTGAGRAWTDQVEGFHTYLATAEAEQLKFEEGEDIFSKYLPWAIMFDLTERWTQVCERLVELGRLPATAPYWYYGDTWNLHHLNWQLNTLDHSVGSAIASPPPSVGDTGFGSGGSAFGGGGFGGGGGFSGGGGGGGGGGSW